VSKILIDVDGVVADLKAAILDELQVEDPDPWKWDFIKKLEPSDQEEAHAALDEMEFWERLPLVEGAKKAVKVLKNAGHTIVWVTAPWTSCQGWDVARRSWLNNHFGNDKMIVEADKEKVDGDVFIDDKVENVEAWKKAHPNKKAFIFDQSYNKDYHGAPRFDWSKVELLL
jgi:5'(3')-deoxyribonucleotidase